MLEARALQSTTSFINDAWKSFSQLAWLDPRTTSGTWRVAKDFSGLPAWVCKTVGGDIKCTSLMDWPVTLQE